MQRTILVWTLLAVACAAPPEPVGSEIGFWAGAFEFESGRNRTAEFGSEYRFEPVLWRIRPILGGQVTGDGALYVHGGARFDTYLSERWRLSPFASVGFFDPGRGVDLGSAVEFRSGAELSWQVMPGHRLGLSFYHLSNASLNDRNPGSESLALTWSVDLAPSARPEPGPSTERAPSRR